MPVSRAIVRSISTQAELAGGAEVCGALLGRDDEIAEFVPLANQSPQPETGFFIPASEVHRLERQAAARGVHVAGFYHSHPQGTALPSRSDIEQALPGYIYLIVPGSGAARAWRLRPDRSGFDEIEQFIRDDH